MKVYKALTIAMVVLSLSLLVSVPTYAADSDIVLSEIMINAATGSNGQWVELCNVGTVDVDVNGWTLMSSSTGNGINAATDCPAGDCTVPSGDCWLIATSQANLQAEFTSGGYSAAVDSTKTIFMGMQPYSAASGTAWIVNSSFVAVDCYAWNSPGMCVPMAFGFISYVPSGDGFEGIAAGAPGSPPQPVVNVGVSPIQWDDGIPGGTPYQMTNQQNSGPTAVTLHRVAAGLPWSFGVAAFAGVGLVGGAVGLAVVRRRRRNV